MSYAEPGGVPRFVQLSEVADHLNRLTEKYQRYGGYTISNPFAPPPLAGAYQGGPQERSFMVMVLVPENLLNAATQDIQQLVSLFRERYSQIEILCYSHPVNRYVAS